MRVAVYARISTSNGSQNPEMQLRELREYAARRGCEIAGEYVDAGISGSKDSRPELNRLMADAHRRRFDAVVVWKFDRFARSVSHLLRALETFKALGVEFVSLSEQVDTSTPTGKMVFTVLGAVGELERSLIVERVKAGLRNARAKGKHLGRPCVSVDASRVAVLRAQGQSWASISEKLGIGQGYSAAGSSALAQKPVCHRSRKRLILRVDKGQSRTAQNHEFLGQRRAQPMIRLGAGPTPTFPNKRRVDFSLSAMPAFPPVSSQHA